MAEKKTAAKGYQKFKADLAAGTLGEVYIFCGEESYLREYYLKEVQKKLVPAGFEEFNFHRVAGKGLTMEELTEMTEAMPMMAERTLIVVTDCDLYKLGEEQRTRLIALLDDFPEYCCLIFVYDLVEYKPNKTYKKLYAALSDKAQEVRFEPQDKSDLINWIARRFRATGHDIDARTAEHLMFTCGSLMTGLVPEIEKIGAYAKGRAVTVEDINAVADPVLDAVVFDMTSAVTKGDYDRASELLGQLLKKQEEPIMILGVISKELRRLYTARLALDSGKDKLWLMDLWNMRSDYPARLLLDAARALVYGDLFMRCLYRVRPYEKTPGSAEVLHQKWKDICVDSLVNPKTKWRYADVCRGIVADFDELPIDETLHKPRVGIVGEILVKYMPLANNHLVELLEREGAEAVVPDLLDFFNYCAFGSQYKAEYLGAKKSAAAASRLAIRLIAALRKPATDALAASRRFEPPMPIEKVAELAKPFLSIGNQYGEGWFLTGEMAELVLSGTPNIVCIQPFACLPNHVVGKGVIKALKKAYPQSNIVAVDYDPGASEVNQLNRIKLMLSTAKKRLAEEEAAAV